MTQEPADDRTPAPSDSASDGSLLRRFRDGSQDAATRLHTRYADRLRALAQTNLTPALARRVDADDIVQSAFRCFFNAVRQGSYDLPSGEDLWSLLMVITLNRLRVARSFHQAAKRDVRRGVDADALDQQPQWMPASPQDATGAFLKLMIAEAMEQLPPHHRTVIQLRLEGHEVAEIAGIVARSKRTVERILQEARNQLRTLLEVEESHDDDPSPMA